MEKYPNKVWIGADLKQAELFFLYIFSGDLKLKEALESNDPHKMVAQNIFSLSDLEDVTKEQREIGKKANYSFPYSGFNVHITAANILRDKPDLDNEVVERALEAYLEEYHVLDEWVNRLLLDWYQSAEGTCTYFLGGKTNISRPSWLKEDVSKIRSNSQAWKVINAMGQQSVGLLLKVFYSHIKNTPVLRQNLTQHIQIFDSLIALADVTKLKIILEEMELMMTPILRHNGNEIRLKTDWKISDKSWGDLESLKKEIDISHKEPIVLEW